MINQRLLVSDAEHFSIAEPINPYYGESALDQNRAIAEHQNIVDQFRNYGIEIQQVASPSTSQDGVYTANWALIRNNQAVLSRLPGPRRTEETYVRFILSELGYKIIEVPDGLRFSGQGDALAIQNFLLCGQKYRSDPVAQAFAADTLGYDYVQLECVPLEPPGFNAVTGWEDSFFYDIDLAIAVIDPELIAYCPAAFTAESNEIIASLPNIRKIPVSYPEARNCYALNLLSDSQNVFMSASAVGLQKQLRLLGKNVIPLSAPELTKGGGFIRCIALTLDNPDYR
jgi:N-dimethylarginine dimethylaminohydrolase